MRDSKLCWKIENLLVELDKDEKRLMASNWNYELKCSSSYDGRKYKW